MSDAVLLILRVPESDRHGVTLKRVNGLLDVTPNGGQCSAVSEDAAENAFLYAHSSSRRLVVLQLLTSDLFHWGVCDNILSGQAKMRFVGYIREQLLDRSMDTTMMLEEKAKKYGVPIEIKKIETDDPSSAALDEARLSYDRIFIAREKRKIFPLFKRNMGQHLRKNITTPVVTG